MGPEAGGEERRAGMSSSGKKYLPGMDSKGSYYVDNEMRRRFISRIRKNLGAKSLNFLYGCADLLKFNHTCMEMEWQYACLHQNLLADKAGHEAVKRLGH